MVELSPAAGDQDHEAPALAANSTDAPVLMLVLPTGMMAAEVEVPVTEMSSTPYWHVLPFCQKRSLRLGVAGIVPAAVV